MPLSAHLAYLSVATSKILCCAGDIMLHETYTSCIKPDGIYEGKTIKQSDVIELQRGGTGMQAY